MISTPVAEEMGLAVIGSTPVMGVGGIVDGSIFRAGSIAIGPLTMDEPLLIGVDLSPFEPVFGVKLGGIIGYGMFSHCVVEYDIAGPTIVLHDPTDYELQGVSDVRRMHLVSLQLLKEASS